MSWTETDDAELQACLDRLLNKQKELQAILTPVGIIINNTKQIQSREIKSYTENREQKITKISPKDQWGEDLTYEARLEIKNQCIAKTTELLGEPDE